MLMTSVNDHQGKPIENFLTVEEAIELTGYTGQYLRRMARHGRLQAIKRGAFWLIERSSLEAYLKTARRRDDKRYGPREPNQ